jgi:hypothetical protein
MVATKATVFFKFKTVWGPPLILGGRIIASFALVACQYNHIAHFYTPRH